MSCGAFQKVKTPSQTEATFWKLCYKDDGSPHYPETEYPYENPRCDTPQEIVWKTLPVRIALEPTYDDEQGHIQVRAVSVWNLWAGGKIFKIVPITEPHDVTISYGDFDLGHAIGIAAQAPHVKDKNGVITFNVYVYEGGLYNVSTAVHELGHVLGLQHDDSPRSIMFSGAEYVPWLTRADSLALRKKYHLPFSVCLL